MPQTKIDSFFPARKKVEAGKEGGQKRKVISDQAENIETAAVEASYTVHSRSPLKPEAAQQQQQSQAPLPRTPQKFQSPSKELDFSALEGNRMKRARLTQLNRRLEAALEIQKAKVRAKEERLSNAAKTENSSSSGSDPNCPKLSRVSLLLEVPIALTTPLNSPVKKVPVTPTKSASTKIKASPRGWSSCEKYLRLTDHAEEVALKLPYKYKFLLEVFRNVEQVVSMKFNRGDRILVSDLKPAVQTAMKRNFTDRYLTQIRAVFPQAYHYLWKPKQSPFGQTKAGYVLHMCPNLSYRADLEHGIRISDEKFSTGGTLSVKDLVGRRKIFTGLLLTLVHDQHQAFLSELEPPLSLPYEDITSWHSEFDIESCHDIDMVHLPQKPDEEVPCPEANPSRGASRNLFGVTRDEVELLEPPSMVSPAEKRLEGLPPGVVKRIVDRQIRAMTEKPEDKKRAEMIEELQEFGPLVLNCLISEKHRQCRGAVALQPFVKFVQQSYGRPGLSEKDTEALLRGLVSLAPDWLEVVCVRRVEYLKSPALAPDSNALRNRLKSLNNKNI